MRGENVACSLGALHYIAAMVILLDSIIFMFGFSPFFINKLAPAAYLIITYCIAAGSLFFCYPRQRLFGTRMSMETIIYRRQLRAYRRKRCFSQNPNSRLRTKEAQLEKVEQ